MHESARSFADTAQSTPIPTVQTSQVEKPYHKERVGRHRLEICITRKDLHAKPSHPHFVIRATREGASALPEFHIRSFKNTSSDIPSTKGKRELRGLLKEIRKNLRAL